MNRKREIRSRIVLNNLILLEVKNTKDYTDFAEPQSV